MNSGLTLKYLDPGFLAKKTRVTLVVSSLP